MKKESTKHKPNTKPKLSRVAFSLSPSMFKISKPKAKQRQIANEITRRRMSLSRRSSTRLSEMHSKLLIPGRPSSLPSGSSSSRLRRRRRQPSRPSGRNSWTPGSLVTWHFSATSGTSCRLKSRPDTSTVSASVSPIRTRWRSPSSFRSGSCPPTGR